MPGSFGFPTETPAEAGAGGGPDLNTGLRPREITVGSEPSVRKRRDLSQTAVLPVVRSLEQMLPGRVWQAPAYGGIGRIGDALLPEKTNRLSSGVVSPDHNFKSNLDFTDVHS